MTDRITKVVLRGDIGDLTAKLRAVSGAVRNTANDLTGASKEAAKYREGMTALGGAATRAGLVATAGVALVTKAAMDWESAWAGVTKTVDATPAQLSAIEQGLRDMTGVLPATHDELAGIAEAAGQLGVESGSILAFTRVMADLGETTNLTSQEAAESIAQFMNVMQTAPGDVDNLASTLVALGNSGASTERDIIQMAQNIAGAGAIVGASEGEILALSNALASVGIEAEAGGSSVSKILIDMSTAVQTNGADLETWASTAGMSTKEFADSFQKDPIRAFDAFTQGLGRINAEGGDVFSLLSNLGQTDIRVTRALLGMANSGDLLAGSLSKQQVEWKRNNALQKEAEKRYDTTSAKARMAWNDIKDSAIDAGQGMLPVVSSVAETIGTVTDAFGALPAPVKSAVGVLGGVGAAGLLAVGGLAKLASTVASARDAMQTLNLTSATLPGGLTKAGRAATLVAGAFAALQVAGQFTSKASVEGVNEYALALAKLGTGAKGAMGGLDALVQMDPTTSFGGTFVLSAGIDSLREAIDGVDAGKVRRLVDHITPYDDTFDNASKSVGQLDNALSSLVMSGAVDEAGAAFTAMQKETGRSGKELLKFFPEYKNALAGAEVQQDDTAAAAKRMAAATESAAADMGMSVEEYQAATDAAKTTGEAFIGLGDSLNDSKVSLSDWLGELEKQNDALAAFTDNAIQAGQKGLDEGLIASLQAAGPEGALRLAELADATEAEIGRANDAWRDGQATVAEYIAATTGVRPEVVTQFEAAGAKNAIDTAVALADTYNLQPDVVRTILEALDYASADISVVLERMGNLDGTRARVVVSASTSQALADAYAARAAIDGMTASIYVTATGPGLHVAKGGRGGTSTRDADGSIHLPGGRRITAFGRGGFEDHSAQITAAGGPIRIWSEPETGGEAYIPLAASKRQRSQKIALETVDRLGGIAFFANGGVAGGSQPSGPLIADLRGARVEMGADGFGTFVAGQVVLHQSNKSNRVARDQRANRPGRP